MAISASMIKELRERTGAGIMDCKKVLTETDGDIEEAIVALRKKGAATAAKKATRIAAEGVVVMAKNPTASVLVEVNCETDFVAKDRSFITFSQDVAQVILDNRITDMSALNSAPLGRKTVESARAELITKIGENIHVRRFEWMHHDDGSVRGDYLHGSRIGVLVKLIGGTGVLAGDLAMHIAASQPMCISEQDMPQALLARERTIFEAQARESGKPDDIIVKMVDGKIKKFLKENSLLQQSFVKDLDQTVGQLVTAAGATVEQMARFEVGEGLEKRSDDFVAEVMAQAGGD